MNLRDNRLLAALPDEIHARLRPKLKPVSLKLGETLYRPGQALRHVYFPLDAVVAKIHLTTDGNTASLGVIGPEGVVGMSSFLGGLETVTETRVIAEGSALRLEIRTLEQEFERGNAFQKALLAFTHAFVAQTGQIAVCNRHHTVEQQLCFWLLLCLDRLPSNELHVTQELLASLLGVRREGVTRAALKLKEAGLLEYKHGHIRVFDPARLRSLACECYYIVHNIYETTLPADISEHGLNKAAAGHRPRAGRKNRIATGATAPPRG